MSMQFPSSLHADGWTDHMPTARPRSTAPYAQFAENAHSDLPPLRVEDDEAMPLQPARRRTPRASTLMAVLGVGAVAASMAVVYAHDPSRVDAEIDAALAHVGGGTQPDHANAAPADQTSRVAQADTTAPAASDAQTQQPLAMAAPGAGPGTAAPDTSANTPSTTAPAKADAQATASPPTTAQASTAKQVARASTPVPKERLSQLAQAPSALPPLPTAPTMPEVQPQAPQAQALPAALPASAPQLVAETASQPASAPASAPASGE